MAQNGHDKKRNLEHWLTIVASIATIIASICAISGFQIFREAYLLPSKEIIPISDDKFEKQSDFSVEVKTRLTDTDDKNWYDSINAQVGDKVEFQIQYHNVSKYIQKNVVIKDILPENMQYVEGSTILYNWNHPNGFSVDQDKIIDSGINIGHYKQGANAYVRFSAIITDKSLETGYNTLANWSQASVGEITLQDYACVYVQLDQ